MKANSDKSHILLSSEERHIAMVNNNEIANSCSEKLLGVTIDCNLSFDEHLNQLCSRAGQKLHALARMSKYMNTSQKRTIMKAFITSQFGYCPLIWMFCSRALNTRMNKIHERALRIVYKDYTSSFYYLLDKDESVSIHIKNLQKLVIEIFKMKQDDSQEILKTIFKTSENKYSLRRNTIFSSRNIRTEHFGIETLSHLGSKLWPQVPNSIKSSPSLSIFKNKIKKWKPEKCPCKLCKIFVPNLGYL